MPVRRHWKRTAAANIAARWAASVASVRLSPDVICPFRPQSHTRTIVARTDRSSRPERCRSSRRPGQSGQPPVGVLAGFRRSGADRGRGQVAGVRWSQAGASYFVSAEHGEEDHDGHEEQDRAEGVTRLAARRGFGFTDWVDDIVVSGDEVQ